MFSRGALSSRCRRCLRLSIPLLVPQWYRTRCRNFLRPTRSTLTPVPFPRCPHCPYRRWFVEEETLLSVNQFLKHCCRCCRSRGRSCDRHLLGRTPGEEAELFAVARITVIHVADVCTNDCRRAVVAEPSSETRVGVSDTHRIIRRRAELGGTCYVQLNRRTRRPNADVAGGRRKHNIVEAGLTTLNRERSRHRAAGEVEVDTGAAHAVGKAQYCSAVV